MRPLIGITAGLQSLDWAGTLPMPAVIGWSSYAEGVAAAGGVPVFLTPHGQGAAELVAALDGILLTGGPDLAPATYGERVVHSTVYGVDEARDSFELELARLAVARDMPLLGICRGHQALNVALGGTLYQHLPDEHPARSNHRQETPADTTVHAVTLQPNSCLARLHGGSDIATNSFHHQGVRQTAAALAPVGWSPEGLVEALEHPGKTFVVSVQWHPEVLFQSQPIHLATFRGLFEAASRRLATR